jgi:hypothetical protein
MGRWGFQDNSRYTNLPPVRSTWHGRRTKAFTNDLNSGPSTHAFSSQRFSPQRPPGSGKDSAHHALRFHARAVITMYAQLLSSVSVGAFSARTPLCNREAPKEDVEKLKLLKGHVRKGQFVTKLRKAFAKEEMSEDLEFVRARVGGKDDDIEYFSILPTSPP